MKRESVAQYLPKSIPVIRRVFLNISGADLPSNLRWVVDEIIAVLNAADIETILSEMDSRGKTDRDPFTYFYEDFLSLYDPEKREKRGVYYTPRPVVNYIVKSVEWVIKNSFRKELGYADDNVTVLDPAIGTGTFLWLVYLRTLGELKERGLRGLINDKIRNHVLKDFFGLEILITPYIISHIKLSLILKRWFYELRNDDRVQVYMTNSLEQGEEHGLLPFMKEINEERKIAHDLVMSRPILAIIGNPPYSGASANKGVWIDALLKKGYSRSDGSKDGGYYRVDGQPLGERNPKWLLDDYVKFIRLAQWKIDSSGIGVVGFITNHAYIDNPTFRGMRQSLMQSFNRIYILNLHGSAKKREKSPDGGRDENVFDIQQGTAILFLVKDPIIKDGSVSYADLFGLRDDKYRWLDRNAIYTTDWKELKPKSPYYLFIPIDESFESKYQCYWKITDIFKQNVLGFQTHRDRFAIDFDRDQIYQRLKTLRAQDLSDDTIRQKYNLRDNRDWKLKKAREVIKADEKWEDSIIQCAYRPFDNRWCYFSTVAMDYPRKILIDNVAGKENISLLLPRQIGVLPWQHIFVSNIVPESCLVSNRTKEGNYVFPLYLYGEEQTQEDNISPSFIEFLEKMYKNKVSSHEIICYIYGILHSDVYRSTFKDFLRIDFPRIPLVKDFETFGQISKLGKELVELHLMRKNLPIQVKFDIQGSNKIDFVKYENSRIYINSTQFFEGVSEDIWNYYIGGYKVLDKWLKSRKKKILTGQEIYLFLQIIAIIKETIRIIDEIEDIGILSHIM